LIPVTKKFFIPILLISAIVIFIFFETNPSINIPDISVDEANVGCIVLHIIDNKPITWDKGDLIFCGRHLPLISDPRHGALECYILLPFILLCGIKLEALRIAPVIFGAITIILVYLFSSRFFNRTIGIITSLLLATNVFFISIIKMSATYGFTIPFFSLISLLFFIYYHNKKEKIYFYLGMLVLGLGFNIRGYFLYFITALFLSGLFFYLRRLSLKTILLGFVCFIMGAIPILYYYYRVDFIHCYVLSDFPTTSLGFNNSHIFKNFLIRLGQLNISLFGEKYGSKTIQKAQVFLFWASFFFILYKTFVTKRTKLSKKRILFILSLFVLTSLSSLITFSVYHIGHLFVLMPYAIMIIGIALWEMFSCNNNFIKSAVLIILAALLTFNISRCIDQYCHLTTENKLCKISGNIQDITSWLLKNKFDRAVCFDFDIYGGIRFFSNFKIETLYYRPYDFGARGKLKPAEFIYNEIKDLKPNTAFVATPAYFNIIYHNFTFISRKLGKELIFRKRFPAQGDLRFMVWKVK